MTQHSDIIKRGGECAHTLTRWLRTSRDSLFLTCQDCGTPLKSDTIAHSANPSLANQTDPEEQRAWAEDLLR